MCIVCSHFFIYALWINSSENLLEVEEKLIVVPVSEKQRAKEKSRELKWLKMGR